MNKEQKNRLEALVKQDPYTGIEDAANALGVTKEAIRKHIKNEQGISAGWESYTGIKRQQRSARNRSLLFAKAARNDDIEKMIVKAAQETESRNLGVIAQHLGLTRDALTYRMRRRGTNLSKIMREHANIGFQKEKLVEVIERELLANNNLTRKEFAESIGVSVNSVERALRRNHGTTWSDVKERTLKEPTTRANKAIKSLIPVTDNPVEPARIVVPEHLVMPLRSYRHSKVVYKNTEARL